MMSYVTHIIYSFPSMSSNGSLWFANGSDIRFNNLMNLRGEHRYPKITVAIGGWDNREYFTNLSRSGEAFHAFISNLKEIVLRYKLDGIDVDWEFPGDHPDDKWLFILFIRKIRDYLDMWSAESGHQRYLLTYAGPAGDTMKGFDLQRLFDTDALDWINVMTYDYFGPWVNSSAGRRTGPPAPLFFNGPANYYRWNVHWTMEKYACAVKDWNKLVVGIPLYGRYWTDVNPTPLNDSDPIWREMNEDILLENHIPWYDMKEKYLDNGYVPGYNDKVMGAYAWYAKNQTYVGYESPESASAKVEYAAAAGLGGVMMWTIDYDDDTLSMLKAIRKTDICAQSTEAFKVPEYRCYEPRWWSWSKENINKFGLCGVAAPLLNGLYPVCDSLDVAHSCCGSEGRCGTGKAFCDCPDCVDYGRHPEKILKNSKAPSVNEVQWFTSDLKYFGRCGVNAPLINGTPAICNPDNEKAYCCSDKGRCGTGLEYCDCEGCVNFRENPAFRYSKQRAEIRKWWTWENGSEHVGRCGLLAPRIDGEVAGCDPKSEKGYCCGAFGYCGSGEKFCDCEGCVDYRFL
ncbi:chitinase-3-like protein 1 isoform X2 [Paramacrobiotus metropolitanus]|nr:chitinase-3-like protein 1 isoform X2 [Paramacrobiotus metropolitanus]